MRKQFLSPEDRYAAIARMLLANPGVTGASETARATKSFGFPPKILPPALPIGTRAVIAAL